MDYEYKNQHFSVEIAEALLTKRRSTGIRIKQVEKILLRLHSTHGGLEPPEGECSLVMVKQALRNLSSVAKASEISKDFWRYARANQWICGEGKHWVYLYYFSRDKQDAEHKGQSVWECKIGKVDGVNNKGEIIYDAPERRVKNQTRGTPVRPITALLFRTDLHTALENAIHAILTLQGNHLAQAQGREWFLTNPSDVVHIVASIDFGLLSPVYNLSPILENFERIAS